VGYVGVIVNPMQKNTTIEGICYESYRSGAGGVLIDTVPSLYLQWNVGNCGYQLQSSSYLSVIGLKNGERELSCMTVLNTSFATKTKHAEQVQIKVMIYIEGFTKIADI